MKRRGFLGLIGAAAAAPLVAVAAKPDEAFASPEFESGYDNRHHIMLRLNPEAELGAVQRYCRIDVATYPGRLPKVATMVRFAECKMAVGSMRDDPDHEIIIGTRELAPADLTAYERQLADLAPSMSALIEAVLGEHVRYYA